MVELRNRKKRNLLPRNIRDLRKRSPSRKNPKIFLSTIVKTINQTRNLRKRVSIRNHQKADPKRRNQRAPNQKIRRPRKPMTISI